MSPLLEAVGVGHAFSTRIGGVSDPGGPFGTLNFGNPSDAPVQDPASNIRENYRLFLEGAGLGTGRERCTVHQVHGAGVVTRRRGEPHDHDAKADALVSDDPRRLLSIRVADCAPILISTTDGAIVAAVHAGWRGVTAGVVRAAVGAILALQPDLPRAYLVAAIGPCIGVGAFEVGPEVVSSLHAAAGHGLFGDRGPGEVIRRDARSARLHVDLCTAIKLQLVTEGLRPDRIDHTDRCSHCDSAEFFSHRRDQGVTGRMAAFISARTPTS